MSTLHKSYDVNNNIRFNVSHVTVFSRNGVQRSATTVSLSFFDSYLFCNNHFFNPEIPGFGR